MSSTYNIFRTTRHVQQVKIQVLFQFKHSWALVTGVERLPGVLPTVGLQVGAGSKSFSTFGTVKRFVACVHCLVILEMSKLPELLGTFETTERQLPRVP